MPRRLTTRRSPLRSTFLAGAVALALASGFGSLATPRPVAAGTAETMEASILRWVNDARAAEGLGRLRADGGLGALAGDRAAALASVDRLSHEAAGCLRCQLSDRGVSWDLFGEVLASNDWPWGGESARIVFESWQGSPVHWDILMNPQMDVIGVGVARTAGAVIYASAVLVDGAGSPAAPTPRPRPAATPKPAARPAPLTAPAPEPTRAAPTAAFLVGRAGMIAV